MVKAAPCSQRKRYTPSTPTYVASAIAVPFTPGPSLLKIAVHRRSLPLRVESPLLRTVLRRVLHVLIFYVAPKSSVGGGMRACVGVGRGWRKMTRTTTTNTFTCRPRAAWGVACVVLGPESWAYRPGRPSSCCAVYFNLVPSSVAPCTPALAHASSLGTDLARKTRAPHFTPQHWLLCHVG